MKTTILSHVDITLYIIGKRTIYNTIIEQRQINLLFQFITNAIYYFFFLLKAFEGRITYYSGKSQI